MGREAQTLCQLGGATPQPVKALLEGTELILRGTVKARWPLAGLRAVRVAGEALCFDAPGGEPVQLQLGAAEAGQWLRKMQTPPPSLAAKLGLSPEQPVATFGAVDEDPLLAEALQGARTDDAARAALLIALVKSEADLQAALACAAALPQARFVWLVNVKGAKSPLGENAIRERLRAQGWRDSKTCAVSATLSATRYGRA